MNENAAEIYEIIWLDSKKNQIIIHDGRIKTRYIEEFNTDKNGFISFEDLDIDPINKQDIIAIIPCEMGDPISVSNGKMVPIIKNIAKTKAEI